MPGVSLIAFVALSLAADADPMICIVHDKKPTIFTPKQECATEAGWRRILRARRVDPIGPFEGYNVRAARRALAEPFEVPQERDGFPYRSEPLPNLPR